MTLDDSCADATRCWDTEEFCVPDECFVEDAACKKGDEVVVTDRNADWLAVGPEA